MFRMPPASALTGSDVIAAGRDFSPAASLPLESGIFAGGLPVKERAWHDDDARFASGQQLLEHLHDRLGAEFLRQLVRLLAVWSSAPSFRPLPRV